MAKFTAKEILEKKIWKDFVLSQNPKSFLQSWNWGETSKFVGDKVFRLGFFSGKKLVGVCLLIKQQAKRGPHLLLPGGPILDWGNKELVDFFIQEIRKIGEKEGAWFIRVRPELFDTKENTKLFKHLGFISSPMHLHAENTWILNIEKSDEETLAGMRKNTRYEVRKGLKAGLTFQELTNFDDVKILTKLQNETVKRHRFVGFSEKLFKAQLATFGNDNQAKLYFCKKGKEVLVAAIIIFYGDYAYYHHSASSEKARKLPASYFLQWKIIQEAKRKGCKFYNFWGIAPEGNKKHRFSGVTTFKKGFGGERVDWLHAHDLPILPLYFATYVFEMGRKFLRRL